MGGKVFGNGDIHNRQTPRAAQYQKTNNPTEKWAKDLTDISPEKAARWPQAPEKVLSITNH